MSIELIDLGEGDLEWVADQEREIFGAAAWSERLIRDDWAFGGKRYRGARLDGELVAYAVYGYDGDAFHLMNIAVVPGLRRSGIGRLLMEDFLGDARALDAHAAWLEVAVTNEAAIALYRDYGFRDVRIRRRYYQPGDVDAVVMRLSLADRTGSSQEFRS